MPEVRLTMREINNRELPQVCISCWRRARYFVERKYTVESRENRWRSTTTRWRSITLPMPMCQKHADLGDRTQARAIGDRSIILVGVSPDFVDALWDIRDGIAKIQDISARVGGPEEEEERLRPPPVRRRPRRSDYEDDEDLLYAGKNNSAGWVIGIVIGIIALIFAVLFGLANLGPGGGRGGGRGGPPFGPR
jgi:hypothetical protein